MWLKLKAYVREHRVGFYSTVIFHLLVLIILLSFSIGTVARMETSFVLDFTKQEELERREKEREFKEDVKEQLDNILKSTRNDIRNVAVDAGSKLKDDRFKNPSEVYDQAKELQRKLDASKKDALAQKAADDAAELAVRNAESDVKDDNQPAYQGPSVIAYELIGRKAIYLPVPAYKGYGSGDVLVEIEVNRKGRVTGARVLESASTADESLHEFAIEAAKRSRFNSSQSADRSQTGTILYRFIAQ